MLTIIGTSTLLEGGEQVLDQDLHFELSSLHQSQWSLLLFGWRSKTMPTLSILILCRSQHRDSWLQNNMGEWDLKTARTSQGERNNATAAGCMSHDRILPFQRHFRAPSGPCFEVSEKHEPGRSSKVDKPSVLISKQR